MHEYGHNSVRAKTVPDWGNSSQSASRNVARPKTISDWGHVSQSASPNELRPTTVSDWSHGSQSASTNELRPKTVSDLGHGIKPATGGELRPKNTPRWGHESQSEQRSRSNSAEQVASAVPALMSLPQQYSSKSAPQPLNELVSSQKKNSTASYNKSPQQAGHATPVTKSSVLTDDHLKDKKSAEDYQKSIKETASVNSNGKAHVPEKNIVNLKSSTLTSNDRTKDMGWLARSMAVNDVADLVGKSEQLIFLKKFIKSRNYGNIIIEGDRGTGKVL